MSHFPLSFQLLQCVPVFGFSCGPKNDDCLIVISCLCVLVFPKLDKNLSSHRRQENTRAAKIHVYLPPYWNTDEFSNEVIIIGM